MRISIFGLGYVGAVSVACLARDGHQVTGVDIDNSKLRMIQDGRSPIVEEGMLDLMQSAVASGRVSVSNDAATAIASTDLSFVCVGTPSLPNGDQDLGAITRLAGEIGHALGKTDNTHTLVVRSTVRPGTVEEVIVPILEERSGKVAGRDFSVCFQPEFLREGSSIRDYDNPPMTVVGASDRHAFDTIKQVFGHLPCEFIETDIRTAEMLKYACNAFHALKITFANEIGRICQSLGTNSHSVMEVLCKDRHLNISPAYLRPGFAFGGSCLPKDLRSLMYLAKHNDVDTPTLSSLIPSNRIHIEHALDAILAEGRKSIGVIGLSFKSGTDDLRESPMVALVESLIGKGLSIKVFDPEVRVSRLIGANRRYIEETIPHIGTIMCDTFEEAVLSTDVIVFGLQGDALVKQLLHHERADQYVLDLIGIDCRDKLKARYRGVCW
jgi:GDP-mannose 6-dehydrogenase